MSQNSGIPISGRKSGLRPLIGGLLPLFVVAHFTHHLITALITPLLPLIRDDFKLDYTKAGFVISAFSLSYGFAQLPAGWLADRIGRRVLITLSISGVATAGLLIGLSRSYSTLILLLFLMGILGGGYHPSAPPLVINAVEPKAQSRALGFHMVGGTASHFLAPLVGVAIASAWGWRGSYIALAIPTVIFGIILYFLLGRQGVSQSTQAKVVAGGVESGSHLLSLHRLASFVVLSTLVQASNAAAILFLPLFLVDRFGIDKKLAAAMLSLVHFAGI